MSARQPLYIIGNKSDTLNAGGLNWSYLGGETSEAHWEGSYDMVLAEYNLQKAVSGIAPIWDTLDFRWNHGQAELHAKGVADGEILYELLRLESRLPVQKHPYFQKGGKYALTPLDIAMVMGAWNLGTTITVEGKVIPYFPGENGTNYLFETGSNQRRLWDYVASGNTEIPMTDWNIRTTQNCSLRSTGKQVVSAGINKVGTPPPSSVLNALVGELPDNLQWLYKGGDVTGHQLGRMKITSEWWSVENPPGWPDLLDGAFDPTTEDT